MSTQDRITQIENDLAAHRRSWVTWPAEALTAMKVERLALLRSK